MAFSNVAVSDSYFLWLTRTNQVLNYLNTLDVTNILNFVSNNAPLSITAGTLKYGNTYIALDIRSDLNDANTKNIASMSSVNTVYQYARSVSTTSNSAYTQANTGTTLANNAYLSSNTVNASVASVYTLANAHTITIASAYATANAAGSPSAIATAYAQANSGTTLANNAYIFANGVSTTVTSTYSLANSQTTTLASAYAAANAASGIANTYALAISTAVGVASNSVSSSIGTAGNVYASSVGVGANTYALAAFNAANAAASSVATYSSNGTVKLGSSSAYRAGTSNTLVPTIANIANAFSEVTLTDAATIAIDLSTGYNFTVTLTTSRIIGAPTNAGINKAGYIRIVQSATGSCVVSYAANWYFAGANAPSASTAANAEDILFYQVISPTKILGTLVKAIG